MGDHTAQRGRGRARAIARVLPALGEPGPIESGLKTLDYIVVLMNVGEPLERQHAWLSPAQAITSVPERCPNSRKLTRNQASRGEERSAVSCYLPALYITSCITSCNSADFAAAV
jgi:hypothetical protein